MSVQKFVVLSENNVLEQGTPVAVSTGPGDSGSLVALNSQGQIDASLIPNTGGVSGGTTINMAILTIPATQTISAYLAVGLTPEGLIPSDPNDVANWASTLGISTNGALAGQDVIIQAYGPLTYSGWNFTPGIPVYIGSGGVLTQTAPSTGYIRIVGTPLTSTTLLIELQPPIIIA